MITTTNVPIAPPTKPSIVLDGLIHARSGVRPVAAPTKNAATSLAITPTTTRNNVSVPIFSKPGPEFESRKMSAPYEPNSPTQTIPSMVNPKFGTGPLSTELVPMKLTAPAINENTNTSGNAASPIQYAASGAATQPAIPTIIAG